MKDRWKTNLSDWDKHIRFGLLIPFFWGFHKMQSKVNPKLAGKREDRIADLARGLQEASGRPYQECFDDIKCEWDYFDLHGIKEWNNK